MAGAKTMLDALERQKWEDTGTSPGNTSYPAPQAGNPETQAEYPASQAGNSETQAEYPASQAGYPEKQAKYFASQAEYPENQAEYPGPKAGYTGTQTDYLVLPAGYSGSCPVGSPIQYQSVPLRPGVPAGLPWIPALPPSPDCPPGLEYLNQIDRIQIHQQIELTDVLTSHETNNKYEIKDNFGQCIYFAAEDTTFCTRCCYGSFRPFIIKILDLKGQEIITLKRPLRCTSCCFPCCLQEIEVHTPHGVPIGYVTQTWHPYLPKFTIQNENKMDILRIIGPCLVCNCCGNVDFKIKSLDGKNVVGKISKQFTKIMREMFTHYSNYGIQFPSDVDVKIKAVIIGTCFLIDFMFYENNGCFQLLTLGIW
ncbi:phospholipid scramblase 2-like [Camelus dromedarius]|uniref:phospholipid scramblase 2-like n=1 Tax=Camelus dromedarius TaxID=9838 RepID=UPI00057B9C69|nr:phospholipid scramblase 2-like [Camelus dromedarius]